MARGPLTFRQRDVTAAIKAAVAAGCVVLRVEIGKDGRIVVVTAGAGPAAPATPAESVNEWDSVLA